MQSLSLLRHACTSLPKAFETQVKFCHHVFRLNELIRQPATDKYELSHLKTCDIDVAVAITKKYFLSEHVMVKSRNMRLDDDNSIDDYLVKIMKQGNGLVLRNENNSIIGLCVGYASCPVDPNSLRNYAFYRQDQNTKDFLYFMAKLQETPNLWNVLTQRKIYEIKILTVLPEYRRRGLAVMMLEESKKHARDQGYQFTRMNCINPYDYKVAERCMLQCIAKFPLHKLRGPHAPFIKRNSEYNRWVRVYIDAPPLADRPDKTTVRQIQADVENRLQASCLLE